MKKVNISPLSGTQELLPGAQAIFNNLKTKIAAAYKAHGFIDIETPCLERTEVLFAKAGGETEKQIYQVKKSGDATSTDTKESLRFDHTVPLARYIAANETHLDFPFKAAQIGINFRGERAQKGRFREFYQCDIDVIGRGTLPLAYDADVISTLFDALSVFELDTPIVARISNRKILSGLIESLDLTKQSADIHSIIDHTEKVTPEQTKTSFEEIGLTKSQVAILLDLINLHGKRSDVITALNNLEIDNPLFREGVTELDQVLYLLESIDLKDQIIADLKIVRGLDYYTGTVFEFSLPEYKNIGSICGGGRYNNLTNYFSNQSFPGIGGSIGLTRLFSVLNDQDLLSIDSKDLTEYALIPISDQEVEYAFKLAKELRTKHHSTTLVLTDKKLSDKLSHAANISANGIVIGEEEVASGRLKVKDFATGKTRDFSFVTEETVSTDPTDFWTDPAEPSTFL